MSPDPVLVALLSLVRFPHLFIVFFSMLTTGRCLPFPSQVNGLFSPAGSFDSFPAFLPRFPTPWAVARRERTIIHKDEVSESDNDVEMNAAELEGLLDSDVSHWLAICSVAGDLTPSRPLSSFS
jgi:hypothetical protein